MHQTSIVPGVYLVAVLVIEKRRDVLQGIRHAASDGGPAGVTFSPGSDHEGRVQGRDLGDALPCEDVAHVDRPHAGS